MGQRSQIYIKMENIGKSYFDSVDINNPNSETWRDNIPAYLIEKERHEKWVKIFGNEKHIIVGFHHQWLYGRSFVLVASMLLNITKALCSKDYNCNPFIAKSWETKNNFDALPRTCEQNNPLSGIKYLQDLISNLFDFELSKYARTGIEGYCLLNGEDEDESELITRFDTGDNNDGVLIFDFTKNKYCFVNIGGDSTVNKLKSFTPVDAHAYLKAYYPECLTDCTKDEIEHARENNRPINHTTNIKVNKKFLKRFKGFKTLSVEELITIFPVMEKDLIEENKNAISVTQFQ